MADSAAVDDTVVLGKITDDGIAKMRERIGVLVPQAAPFNREASIDGLRHFAQGYGDDNPLYSEEDYGSQTRWGSIIASPLFVMTMGKSEIKTIRPEIRQRGAHALAGVHEFFSGDDWEFFRPVLPGDRMTKRYYLCAVDEKETSSMGGGRSVHTRYRADFTNQRGELVAIERFRYVRVERDAARKSGKNTALEPAVYSDEQIDAIEAAYGNQPPPRGGETRYWEDVAIGEELPCLPKGPLTITDTIVWMRGWGSQVHGHRLAWKHRQRAPKFFSRNEHNAWDIVERVHWDDAIARAVGNPAAYDFGRMRSAFVSHVVTNWMGDSAWLWKMTSEYRKFNFVGDMHWVKGRVSGKSVEGGHHVIDIEITCENQRGEVTAPGSAKVILPSRASGEMRLPQPDGADDVPLIF
jgi:acyl dehydratase